MPDNWRYQYIKISKIFEKCVLNKLMFHISFHDVFVPNKYGFRSSSSSSSFIHTYSIAIQQQ